MNLSGKVAKMASHEAAVAAGLVEYTADYLRSKAYLLENRRFFVGQARTNNGLE